uniref:Uncharacterized protein n=1 Tax=Calidris pygmaea TaxID=425635 RepID=A0A8C3JJE1_9CHAR
QYGRRYLCLNKSFSLPISPASLASMLLWGGLHSTHLHCQSWHWSEMWITPTISHQLLWNGPNVARAFPTHPVPLAFSRLLEIIRRL